MQITRVDDNYITLTVDGDNELIYWPTKYAIDFTRITDFPAHIRQMSEKFKKEDKDNGMEEKND